MTSKTNSPPHSPAPAAPGFGRRLANFLGRLLKAALKVTAVLLIIAGIGFITLLVVQELRRSFNVVDDRVDYNFDQIMAVRGDLAALQTAVAEAEQAQTGRLADLEAYQAGALAESLIAHEQSLDQQEAVLTALEIQLNELLSTTQTLDAQIVGLNEGILALQSDVNTNTTQLDELGGELDTVRLQNEALAGQVTQLQTGIDDLPLSDIEQMRQVVTLFRVWEMVTRARLRLLEGNAGLAGADTARAMAAMEAILTDEASNQALLPRYALVQARLNMAAANLPANPSLAASDLESAWAELDTILALLLGLEPAQPDTAVLPPAPTPPPAASPAATPGG